MSVREYADDALLNGGGDLNEIALALGGEVRGRAIVAPSPGMPDTDRSMVIHVDPATPHNFFIYGCEGSLGKARDVVAKKLKLIAPSADAADERSAQALRIWQETVPATGTLVERYLRSRGIDIPVPDALRFHGALRHGPTSGRWPAMVAAVVDLGGHTVAIHRTFLKLDGSGKAPIDPNRMTLGPIGGNAIRLAAATDEVVVGEGIETCLSVTAATGKPSWSAISAVGLRTLILPDAIRTVTILADGDEAGEAAASAASRRWIGEGRRVLIARAPKGHDFNDVLMGKVGVP